MQIDTNGIEIEDVVRDRISGLEGVVIGMTQWTTGCARASVQPVMAEKQKLDGTGPARPWDVDVLNLELLERGRRHVAAPDPELVGANRGGPNTPSAAQR